MKIPETPHSVADLDLMKLLTAYAQGTVTWNPAAGPLGTAARKECEFLHAHLVELVEKVFAYVLDRVTARELDTFTMHDRFHGLKVAHLMWHITSEERRKALTPPEIALLVLSAHLHDAGMALSRSEREERLKPDSDLWDRLELDVDAKATFLQLYKVIGDPNAFQAQRTRAQHDLQQTEEVLLALDTRERHATPERYRELIAQLASFHEKDKARIPDIEGYLCFDGDSFAEKLIDVCVSHNQCPEALLQKDPTNLDRYRFPRDFPIGCATADLHFVAAALRLGDILDFDRERTPSVLFHYLLPGPLAPPVSLLEWGKHLAISHWEIGPSSLLFRGRSRSHIMHHAVVQFCRTIEDELHATRATFGALQEGDWPFAIPLSAKAEIHEEGYRYLPYRFELDDERVYNLLMGGAIYNNPLVAVRELVQNAVDACQFRDALTRLHEPHIRPEMQNRITVRYEEPSDSSQGVPILSVIDSGSGMDAWAIERWFLKVGRSFFRSADFNRTRLELREKGIDFAPVSEFGIGFLSSFLLADRVEVETALWEPIRSDVRKRHLQIDGPTRLIRLAESPNDGVSRFRGTQVRLFLTRGGQKSFPVHKQPLSPCPPSFEDIKEYLELTCQELPYEINVEHVCATQTHRVPIRPIPPAIELPAQLECGAVHVPVADEAIGLEGEIVIVSGRTMKRFGAERVRRASTLVTPERISTVNPTEANLLLRGGFNLGEVPGAPGSWDGGVFARVKLTWQSTADRRYTSTNLARSGPAAIDSVEAVITRQWVGFLIEHAQWLPEGLMESVMSIGSGRPRRPLGSTLPWLEKYDAYSLYALARNGWAADVGEECLSAWEHGTGGPVLLPSPVLVGDILELVLPRVAKRRLYRWDGDTLIYPPECGWPQILKSWMHFISEPIQWSPFAEYEEKIADPLFHDWTTGKHLLNIRYHNRFASFKIDELNQLPDLFHRLVFNRSFDRQTVLTQSEAGLLERAINVAGDLTIDNSGGQWQLQTFGTAKAVAVK